MINIIKKGLLFLILINNMACAVTSSDSVFIDRMFISNTAKKIIFDEYLPGKNVNTVTNKDKIIFYYALIGIINPTKQRYDVEIICVDAKGDVMFKDTAKRTFSEIEDSVSDDSIKTLEQMLGLDPKPNAMVKGQIMPLKSDQDYFIKLYFEKKLIGVTKFHYQIVD